MCEVNLRVGVVVLTGVPCDDFVPSLVLLKTLNGSFSEVDWLLGVRENAVVRRCNTPDSAEPKERKGEVLYRIE